MHQILFSLGPVTIYSYGLCVALGFLLGMMNAARRARRYGWSAETIYDTCLCAIIAAIVGARILYILDNPGEFAGSPLDYFMVWKGGLVYYGGVIGAVIAGALYLKLKGRGVLEGFDIIIPSVALGHAIGRVGCFLNGCCFGRISSLPWAVRFPPESPAYLYQLCETGQIQPGSAWSLPVHPTQLYEALLEFMICGFLASLFWRKRFHGQIFFLYFVIYGTCRFAVETMRADYPVLIGVCGFGINLPQVMSVLMMIAASVVLLWMRRRAGGRGRDAGGFNRAA
ncbi:MAG: prolipoprotein diacylglyceryl transferase [Candidatus Aureabacteria bacterium]|nr:prolipoprotein diacylglyceryl transferase [Candidatus Auribacterota bacterium]